MSIEKSARQAAGQFSTSITGQQQYHVTVRGTASAAFLSVVSFEAVEALGEPYRITITLTHPQELERADYLGKDASFSMGTGLSEPREFAGCITHFNKLKQTHDFHSYEFVIEPLVARLRLTHASRVFQHQTAPKIIETILRRHGFTGDNFKFRTRRSCPQHAFRLQYQQSDWDFIHLLMQQEGLYSYFIPGMLGDIIVFADDIDHYIYQPELKVPYREAAGLDADAEIVFNLQTQSQTVPASYLVADYYPDAAWERFKDDANVARKDITTYGQPYVYGSHHLDQLSAKWEAQLRHEAAIASQIVYTGESNILELRPARILRMDHALPDAPNGQVIISVTHSGARDTAYKNSYTAIPSDRRYRLPLNEANWPKIAGTLSARVTSPGQYPHAYITKNGHYTVRFDLDFEEWNPGNESVPLRLAKPFAGANQTGFHFPIIDGTEAAIGFTDGNPNKPYIAHLHHNSRHPDLIISEHRWLSRNVIRTQSNNKLRMEDWKGEEHIKLATEHGKSQLNLGHLVDSQRQQRGEGAELRTDNHAVIRGGKGVLITADAQPNAEGLQLEMQAVQTLLEQLQAESQELAHASQAARAEIADLQAEYDWLTNYVKGLQQAALVVSAPAGIAAATPSHINLSAGQTIMQRSGNDHSISAGKRFLLAARQGLSMFAQQCGMKLFASKGKIEIQAQSDEIHAVADNNLTITSVNGKVEINAKEAILLKCGGSYLRIGPLGIESGTLGEIHWKADKFSLQGPAALPQVLPVLPTERGKTDDDFIVSR
ncbi:type VI secretion system secreted protein VgrG [Herbaspirillum sp. Sphag1AN]|uniref:type VI secretion system Vgr family protein n=1 Tax=unclassified Herbaspirillum TaxID=2624150 RepID=UPI00161A7E53|nr:MULTISPECIES: type VI secretion system Vgr family protein [unclassified Herbaspirillum]MBB3214923.1 type VI secretion system secreted protein VgrG [Herbaspirillum sp. Sphag1AN]MBB3248117.1 type VI secretion system secreted protein VgrG [Herbaspirillum sp. Sphag64]